MAISYKSPGVYREEVFLKPEAKLPTGVPGFVGFADDRIQAGLQLNVPLAVHRKDEFVVQPQAQPATFLADAVSGFFDNGGSRCYVVLAAPHEDREPALKAGILTLAPLADLDLVAIPDAMGLQTQTGHFDSQAAMRVQSAALVHCGEQANRLAILDGLPDSGTEDVLGQRRTVVVGQAEPINGALYYPWLKIDTARVVPPCGHVAGIVARTDSKIGVFKAPANEEVLGVLDLDATVDNSVQEILNPAGVNCLRAFPGRGIRVWGARTLSRDPNWCYINVRRLFLTLSRWIDRNMTWAAFESNDQRLWVRIQRELGAYLTGLWRVGALQGKSPEQSFYVKCDVETNPPETREVGQVVTEIGLAPLYPAEFVIVRVVHRTEGIVNV